MGNYRIAPQWTFSGIFRGMVTIKVVIAPDSFLTDVTHHGTTWTHHFIASIILDKPLAALPTNSDNSFSHLVL